ncbi:MAG: hypothetical protein PHP00_00985 [Thiotrichaceae bacterium]|nr:hypothetical protein [Thiotrichaceae bacterium]
MKLKTSKFMGLLTLAALCSYSSTVLAAICTAPGAGNWSAPATWGAGGGCLGVPLAADTVILNGAVLLDTATAVASGVTVNAALTFAAGGVLTIGTGGHGTGFLNTTTVTATNGSAIIIDTHLDNVVAFDNQGTFTLGNVSVGATLSVSGIDGKGITNSGTFTGGLGAISTNSFTNTANTFDLNGPMNISFLNGVASSLFTNTAGTVTLNGNISIAGSIGAGAGTFAAGAGKMIFTGDANHTITGPVSVHNLEIATLTAARTISISGSVAETGTTVLNGASATNSISFAGSSSPIITAFTSSNCATAGGVANITCPGVVIVSPISAPISLISYEKSPVFSRELTLK